ncbi:hypothetical protein TraAM80_01688 [Trypanosoma rangeli]|uniref:Uncharacterized protein n=1 Tax=Trypanosoma rangeli TaxID=5698 RepID=A0A3R7M782_TRYRA|nr:uncharacterized protein TraAM80_01688 [Trypanosoma rangeli]RNF10329.1 hypothetical protein TraAM80_01688 [Trypanosoma rangeli]|eukprot:RNF10329.1 hypothetical protein TraAM80_01688 [Trypanosoma rangeli]
MTTNLKALPVVLAVVACIVVLVVGIVLCCRGKRGGDPATSANWSSPLLLDKHSLPFESTREEWAHSFGDLASSHARRISEWLLEVRQAVDGSVDLSAGGGISDLPSVTVKGSPVTTASTHFHLDASPGMNNERSVSEYATYSPCVSAVEGAINFRVGHLDPLRR